MCLTQVFPIHFHTGILRTSVVPFTSELCRCFSKTDILYTRAPHSGVCYNAGVFYTAVFHTGMLPFSYTPDRCDSMHRCSSYTSTQMSSLQVRSHAGVDYTGAFSLEAHHLGQPQAGMPHTPASLYPVSPPGCDPADSSAIEVGGPSYTCAIQPLFMPSHYIGFPLQVRPQCGPALPWLRPLI